MGCYDAAWLRQVCFHPEDRGGTFLSASTDGLISVFDISSQLDEDDCFEVSPPSPPLTPPPLPFSSASSGRKGALLGEEGGTGE